MLNWFILCIACTFCFLLMVVWSIKDPAERGVRPNWPPLDPHGNEPFDYSIDPDNPPLRWTPPTPQGDLKGQLAQWDADHALKYPPFDKPSAGMEHRTAEAMTNQHQVYPKWDHFPPTPKPVLTPEQDDDKWCFALGIKHK